MALQAWGACGPLCGVKRALPTCATCREAQVFFSDLCRKEVMVGGRAQGLSPPLGSPWPALPCSPFSCSVGPMDIQRTNQSEMWDGRQNNQTGGHT